MGAKIIEYNNQQLKPLPKEAVSNMGRLIKQSFRSFNPKKEIHHGQMKEVLLRYKRLFNNNLPGYCFDYIYNEKRGINYEIIADLGYKVKLYLLSDQFKDREIADTFMRRYFNLISDLNQSITEWNNISNKNRITFYSKPPVSKINEMFTLKLRDYLRFANTGYLDGFNALEVTRCFDELRFGGDNEWSINVFSEGTIDWGRSQFIIQHKAINFGFIAEEIQTPLYGRFSHRQITSAFEYAMKRMLTGLIQWNNEGGKINEKPISFDRF